MVEWSPWSGLDRLRGRGTRLRPGWSVGRTGAGAPARRSASSRRRGGQHARMRGAARGGEPHALAGRCRGAGEAEQSVGSRSGDALPMIGVGMCCGAGPACGHSSHGRGRARLLALANVSRAARGCCVRGGLSYRAQSPNPARRSTGGRRRSLSSGANSATASGRPGSSPRPTPRTARRPSRRRSRPHPRG
jgi:hypothetical protein